MKTRHLAAALLLLAVLDAPPVSSRSEGEAPPYLAVLIQRASARTLHEHPRWLALLHYERSLLGRGARSHASTPDFFLAPDGAVDPRAELNATLAAFFDAARLEKGENAQCAFIARRHWLAEQLDIDDEELPPNRCEHYERWREGLSAVGLTLIFPEGFMNNPASMFGHTLLRLDLTRSAGPEDVLAYAVDFTGDTAGEGGAAFLAKGIFGFYPGAFGVHPYYQQLKRYADWENRDIWEYRLAFTEEELEFMLMHLWELRAVLFPYYFFDENCSYQLLKLMEVGRPDLRLSEKFPFSAIPIDTLRAVTRVPELVTDVLYRPSPATELQHQLRRLSRAGRHLVREIALGDREPENTALDRLPERERAAVLSAAYDWLRYSYLTGRVSDDESRARSRRILVARSRFTAAEETAGRLFDDVPPPEVRPDQGHDSSRVSLGGGLEDGEGYLELRLRPAYHDLIDPQGGFTPHMQIDFLDAKLRYFPSRGRVRLQELVLVQATSLSPRSEVFEPFAWSLDTGLRTRRIPGRNGLNDAPVWRSSIGAGLSQTLGRHWLGYALGEITLDVGPDLEDTASFGPGARWGFLSNLPGDRFKVHLFASATHFAAGDSTTWLRAVLQQRLTLRRNLALTGEGSFNRISEKSWWQMGLALSVYF